MQYEENVKLISEPVFTSDSRAIYETAGAVCPVKNNLPLNS